MWPNPKIKQVAVIRVNLNRLIGWLQVHVITDGSHLEVGVATEDSSALRQVTCEIDSHRDVTPVLLVANCSAFSQMLRNTFRFPWKNHSCLSHRWLSLGGPKKRLCAARPPICPSGITWEAAFVSERILRKVALKYKCPLRPHWIKPGNISVLQACCTALEKIHCTLFFFFFF